MQRIRIHEDDVLFRVWRKGRTQIVCAALATQLLGACAPIYPDVTRKDVVDTCSIQNAVTQDDALRCVDAAQQALDGAAKDIGIYNRSMGLVATSAGGYAGLKASQKNVNGALIRHVAIGVATLAGFDIVMKSDNQMTVLSAGLAALRCVRKAAAATKPSRFVDKNGKRIQPVAALSVDQDSQAFLGQLVGGDKPPASLVAISTRLAQDRSWVTSELLAAQNISTEAWAWNVVNAVDDVLFLTQQQLNARTANVKEIYDAQRTAVTTIAGPEAHATARLRRLNQARSAIAGGIPDEIDAPVENAFNSCVEGKLEP